MARKPMDSYGVSSPFSAGVLGEDDLAAAALLLSEYEL